MNQDELQASLRPWLQRALDTLLEVKRLSRAGDVSDYKKQVPERDVEATKLVSSIGHCDHWQAIVDLAIKNGAVEWVDSGIVNSRGGFGQPLECFWSVHQLRLHLFGGTDTNGLFDWTKTEDSLFHNTIRRLQNAGFEATVNVCESVSVVSPPEHTSITQEAFRATMAGMVPGIITAALKVKAVDRANITMDKMLETGPEIYAEWRLADWEKHLGQSRKTIVKTKAWTETIPAISESLRAAKKVSKKTFPASRTR